MTDLTIDLFAGPGGWEEGARMVGFTGRIVGIEWDDVACATARAAGHERYCADLSLVAVDKFGPFRGLLGSPPCPSFSTAGKGLGKLDMPRIMRHLERVREAGRWLHYSREGWHDDRSPLILEPVRWAMQGRPEWIALEQVPAVLPFWQAFGALLNDLDYDVETRVLSAEQYGVPQTRKRAILVASVGRFLGLPKPTHQAYSKRKPYDPTSSLPRWISMREALGWGMTERPSMTVTGGGLGPAAQNRSATAPGSLCAANWPLGVGHLAMRSNYGTGGDASNRGERRIDEPSATITSKAGRNKWRMQGHQTPGGTARRQERDADEPSMTIASGSRSARWLSNGESLAISTPEAATLQTFRPDFPWRGKRGKQFEQIGNAVPPLLAAAVLGNLLDLPWRDLTMRPADPAERPAA